MALRTTGSSASSEQIDLLLEFLQEHRDLARGFMRGPEARVKSKRLWSNITDRINSLGGAVKTCAQWQKVWADKKHIAKKLAAQRNQAATRTGGGPSVGRPLTEADLKVLSIMGEGFGLPQTSVRTPAILTDENVEEIGVINNWAVDQDHDTPSRDDRVVNNEVVNQDHIYCETLSSSNNYMGGPSSQARRLRWRSQRRQSDLRSQLLDSERKKLAALAGIRTEMAGVRTEMAGVRTELGNLTNILASALEELKRRI